ncbi:hypothetical protein E5D57_004267 [Metarhizium anisopliae]|nr:hypothetical protein E5D57_004267 [Metarhizium anisopliae]
MNGIHLRSNQILPRMAKYSNFKRGKSRDGLPKAVAQERRSRGRGGTRGPGEDAALGEQEASSARSHPNATPVKCKCKCPGPDDVLSSDE